MQNNRREACCYILRDSGASAALATMPCPAVLPSCSCALPSSALTLSPPLPSATSPFSFSLLSATYPMEARTVGQHPAPPGHTRNSARSTVTELRIALPLLCRTVAHMRTRDASASSFQLQDFCCFCTLLMPAVASRAAASSAMPADSSDRRATGHSPGLGGLCGRTGFACFLRRPSS